MYNLIEYTDNYSKIKKNEGVCGNAIEINKVWIKMSFLLLITTVLCLNLKQI